MRNGNKGFTLIELVVVIAILAILAGVAVPQFVGLTREAKIAAEKADVGAVRAGIVNKAINDMMNAVPKKSVPQYPASLEKTITGQTSVFANVLDETSAIDASKRGWSVSGSTYTGPAAGQYTYSVDTANNTYKFIETLAPTGN